MENLKKSLETIYPKSKHNNQCVGPCYFPGTPFIHPITLDEFKKDDDAICPIVPITKRNKTTNAYDIIEYDVCSKPDHNKTKIDELMVSNITTPQTYINSEFFVKIFYGIGSLDEMFEYITTNDIPFVTKKRLFDITFSLFGKNLIVSNKEMEQFYKELLEYNMKFFVQYIKPYLTMKDNKIMIKKDNTNNNVHKLKDDKVEKYIKAKLLTDEKRCNILLRFIRNESDRLGDNKLSDILVRYTMKYIINKIRIS